MEFAHFALDPVDSAITPFLDVQEFQKQLALLSSSQPDWGAVEQVRTEVLKCHPGRRCAFEVSLRSGNVSHELIGKVYKKESLNVFEVMTAIRQAGFNDESEFSIPRPVLYVPALRLLLVEKISGLHAAQIFLEGHPRERKVAAVRSALWLARFHALGGIRGRTLRSDAVFNHCSKTCKRLADCCPSLASKGQRLLEALGPASAALKDIPVGPSHGDFVPAHVFLTGDQVVTVDWDSFVLSDPSRDVARFILGLRRLAERHLGSIRALDPCATLFQETYLSEGHRYVATNVSFYMAALCLRQAKRYVRRQRARWRERAEVLLDEGLRALTQVR